MWRIDRLDETGSTNTVAMDAARSGAAEGLVVVANVHIVRFLRDSSQTG